MTKTIEQYRDFIESLSIPELSFKELIDLYGESIPPLFLRKYKSITPYQPILERANKLLEKQRVKIAIFCREFLKEDENAKDD